MCGGIAIKWQTIPETLRQKYGVGATKVGVESRVIRFHFRDPKPTLPTIYKNELRIYIWGNRDNPDSRLPKTGWCRVESLEEGKWNHLNPEHVEIPAMMGVEKGVWFEIDGGIKWNPC